VSEPTAEAQLPEEEPIESADEPLGDQTVIEDLLVEEVSIDGMCGVY
jgi:mycofactocin precursor